MLSASPLAGAGNGSVPIHGGRRGRSDYETVITDFLPETERTFIRIHTLYFNGS